MKNVNQRSVQGCAKRACGLITQVKILAVILLLVSFAGQTVVASGAMTQLQYLQWMAQLCGDTANFSSGSSAADYINWARAKGMNPSDGWRADAALTKDVLCQTLVQLYALNPKKLGGDLARILEREGINVSDIEGDVSRDEFAALVDDFGFQSRLSVSAIVPAGKGSGNGNGNGPPSTPPGHGDNNPGKGNKDKVAVCKNGHTLMVPEAALQGLLRSGATLGPCSITPSQGQ